MKNSSACVHYFALGTFNLGLTLEKLRMKPKLSWSVALLILLSKQFFGYKK